MAATTIRRWNPIVKTFYERLTAAGKPYEVAITACMRKLSTVPNTMVRDRTFRRPLNPENF
jgi:transposase